MILVSYVCDGVSDCYGNEDEKYCVFFNKLNLFSPSQVCMEMSFVNSKMCPSTKSINEPCDYYTHPLAKFDPLTFDFLSPITTSEDSYSNDPKYCIYEPIECNLMDGNGAHLLSCEDNKCHRKYFKCPGFYCIPWRFVCNGQWECPGGMEEIECQRISCPGMFKCRNSSICLSPDNICDSTVDCLQNDDVVFCPMGQYFHKCPSDCSCLAFTLSCENITYPKANFTSYVSVYFNQINLHGESLILNVFDKVVILVLKCSGISTICRQMKALKR